MGTKVIVNSVSPNRVSINNQQRTTIRTVGISTSSVRRIGDLVDVDVSDADNNETLVYDSTINKYVVKTLPGIDGGTF
jgi:hypothetical protein